MTLPFINYAHTKASTVSLTEYYDYECPHCRKMSTIIQRIKAQYPNVNIINRVTPLLNKVSPYVAELALAGQKLSGNNNLHNSLIHQQDTPTIVSTLQVARQLNLNVSQLLKIAKSEDISKVVLHNITAANHYAINGIIHLPIIILSNGSEHFIFYGETPYPLLAATIQQLQVDHYVQTKQTRTTSANDKVKEKR
jgi:protein-disulfide isomerase